VHKGGWHYVYSRENNEDLLELTNRGAHNFKCLFLFQDGTEIEKKGDAGKSCKAQSRGEDCRLLIA